MSDLIPQTTLLAIDAGTILFIIVFFFSIIGGLQNLLKNQKQPPNLGGRRRQQPQQQNRRPELQDEIDQFLEDVLGKDEVEAARREKEHRENERRRKGQRSRRRQSPPAPAVAAEPKREALISHHLETSGSGGVAAHVEQHMRHLESGVAGHVAEYMGGDSPSSVEQGSPAAREIFAMLGNADGMRQAVLLNEILSPPKSMRRPGGS